MRHLVTGCLALCFAVFSVGLAGCDGPAGTQKLEADADVDWDAIEKAGSEMNKEMNSGENE